ncbi:hypothetical protein [Planktosalinus lacus]|uniref:Lipocalin-like domain-containing protein n=1 Tax=Planktosalinus lacus TaxID=1526573 RepID=A0A8J2V9Z6_9FLAO|nr:hypothetical protein [Planktosalinus lacus]GGD90109.1 hypothetical protein GCM10011312_12530 [Planktosalinus lacus]
MKSIFLTLTVLCLFLSCTDSDDREKQETPLVGTWQMIEAYEPYGENPDGNWYPVENGHFYTFNEDGTMSSNRFNCSNGVYEIETYENIEHRRIIFSFNCENGQQVANFRMPFIETYLFLIDEISCDEGCAEKYVKITNE